MYSIVMVAAMTTAPETPDFFFKNKGCHGCYGCYGGCTGYSCGGCGGCWGWSCGGGCGGCWGCHGYVTVYSHGCRGCLGTCHGCYGGYACTGCCGGYVTPAHPGTYIAPAAPGTAPAAPPAKDGKKDAPKASGKGTEGVSATGLPIADASLPGHRGQVVVRLPADATLFADGHATTLTGTERTFQTPDISEGRDFQYTLKIEYKDGTETKSISKQALVRAGHRTVVDFNVPANSVTTSSVRINLPEKAKLFVDGVAVPTSSGTLEFRTPELTRGKAYIYQFRVETERDGQPEVENREVTFKGGDPVVVNFADVRAIRTAAR